jgi:hypothetical protein
MITSESIGKLAEALAKAQGAIEGAKKDSANPFFKSKYADLASVWDACRKALSENALSVVQTTDSIGDLSDLVIVNTRLCHSSGEWIEGRLIMKPVKADPQGIGSCLTYARRYALSAMVGIAPEDDDGNAATGKVEGHKVYPLKVSKPEMPKVDGMGQDLPPEQDVPEPDMTDMGVEPLLVSGSALHKSIEGLIVQYQVNRELFKGWLMEKQKIGMKDDRPSFSTMTQKDAQSMVEKWNPTMTSYQKWLKKQSGEV